jgi:thiol-disulfide isomerase/thioredoxin
VLKTDVISERFFRYYVSVESMAGWFAGDSLVLQRVVDYYADNLLKKKAYSGESRMALLYSKTLFDYVLIKSKVEGYMNRAAFKGAYANKDMSGLTDVKTILQIADRSLRERTLTTFLVRRRSSFSDSLIFFTKSAKEEFKNAFLLGMLQNLEKTAKGAPMFSFLLPDSSGKEHNIEEILGKTVVIDFWYTGCIWCGYLKKAMRPIIEKRDTSTVFITVSIDRDKETWKRSIQSGLYTTPGEINLLASETKFPNPLLKYYDISGFPFVIIVAPTGKISSINPHGASYTSEAVKKIDDAIKLAATER